MNTTIRNKILNITAGNDDFNNCFGCAEVNEIVSHIAPVQECRITDAAHQLARLVLNSDLYSIENREIQSAVDTVLFLVPEVRREQYSVTAASATEKTTKATKMQAQACYDNYFGVLRCLNGGTREENERSSGRCRIELEKYVREAGAILRNPGKLLAQDARLMRALGEDIPNNFKAFCDRYPVRNPNAEVAQWLIQPYASSATSATLTPKTDQNAS